MPGSANTDSFIPFDDALDKVTEREMVYDIVERLSLGKDLRDAERIYYQNKTPLLDLIRKLITLEPVPVILNYFDIKVGYINIRANGFSGNTTIDGASSVVYAYSQQTGIDMTSFISTSRDTFNNLICSYGSEQPYLNDDIIKIYAK